MAPAETAEEAKARLAAEEVAREAERERGYKEREAQRAEIELEIVAEERRVREKERKKREAITAARKTQKKFIEAAFDGEVQIVRDTISCWVEETLGCTLIGAKVDCMDEHKQTPLSEAACSGETAVCEMLLQHGADPNSRSDQMRTPLWRAAFMGKAETAALLLAWGGDPRLASETQELPKMVAVSLWLEPKAKPAHCCPACLE